MSEEVTVVENAARKRFEAHVGADAAGVLTYSVEDGVMIMPHTVVEPRYEGRGIGGKLAKYALDTARERDMKVAPRCPFVAAYITKNPEYADLVE